jgi:hypothetical protein
MSQLSRYSGAHSNQHSNSSRAIYFFSSLTRYAHSIEVQRAITNSQPNQLLSPHLPLARGNEKRERTGRRIWWFERQTALVFEEDKREKSQTVHQQPWKLCYIHTRKKALHREIGHGSGRKKFEALCLLSAPPVLRWRKLPSAKSAPGESQRYVN